MDVQSGELTGLVAVAASSLAEPLLPPRLDLMMTNVRRIPHEERRSIHGWQRELPVIGDDDASALGHPRRREMSAGKDRGQRIDLDRQQLGLGKATAGGHEEARRTCPWVDNAVGRDLSCRPADHGVDNGVRCVGCARGPTFLRREAAAVGIAEGVRAVLDRRADIAIKQRK